MHKILIILFSIILFYNTWYPLPSPKTAIYFKNETHFNSTANSIQISNILLNIPGDIYMILDVTGGLTPRIEQLKMFHNFDDQPMIGKKVSYENPPIELAFSGLNSSTEYELYFCAFSPDETMFTEVHSQKVKTLARLIETRDDFDRNHVSFVLLLPVILIGLTLLISTLSSMYLPQVKDILNYERSGELFKNKNSDQDKSNGNMMPSQNTIYSNKFSTQEMGLLKAKVKALEDERAELEDRRVCGVCCYSLKDVVFLNCGHIFCCMRCSKNFHKCPFDSQPINLKLQFKRTDFLGKEEVDCGGFIRRQEQTPDGNQNSCESLMKRFENAKLDIKYHKKFEYCGICFRRPREVLFMQCSHVFCCRSCAKIVERCPLDQKPVNWKINLYFT